MKKENHNLKVNNLAMMHSKLFKILFLSIAILLVTSTNIHAQNTPVEICGYQHELEKIIQKQPNYLALQNEWYRKANEAYIEAQSTILPPNLNDNQPPGILVNKRFIIRNILNIRIEFIGFYLS